MTNGGHPLFGGWFEREVDIMENAKSLDGLATFEGEAKEASDLIVQRCQNGVLFLFSFSSLVCQARLFVE